MLQLYPSIRWVGHGCSFTKVRVAGIINYLLTLLLKGTWACAIHIKEVFGRAPHAWKSSLPAKLRYTSLCSQYYTVFPHALPTANQLIDIEDQMTSTLPLCRGCHKQEGEHKSNEQGQSSLKHWQEDQCTLEEVIKKRQCQQPQGWYLTVKDWMEGEILNTLNDGWDRDEL